MEKINPLRRVKIKLGVAEVEVVSEKDDIEKVKGIAEELAKRIRYKGTEEMNYTG